MLELADYTILGQIAEGASTIIYRAIRAKDGNPVILKTLREVYPSPAEVSKFTHEYNISKNLSISHIIQPYALEIVENRPILVLEDLGGESLRRILERGRLSLSVCLDIAIKIADTLDQIHRAGVIHKDLKPDNIIVNLESGLVKITDFSIASYISEDRSSARPDRPEGTLAYMSPEQTGRLNRTIDYRTDFYSFGVMLYELLTGQRPFAGREALELVYAHIAIQPKPPHEVDQSIPPILSEIVLKLMAKTADERYQSASAFLVDLTMCQRQWDEQKRIKAFPLAQQDVSDIFRIPSKIYGREQEQVQLLGAFHRTRVGRSELIFITGSAGIGRDALAAEMRQPVAAQGGYFITGKFAPSGTGMPYSGIISAFKELVRQLLTENEESLRSWRQKIQKALGVEASIIIDVIPEIELIIGPHPDVTDLFPVSNTRNRFHRVITNFVRVFCHSNHPLVMYLDHWQWADAASLKWLQLVLTDETITSLLIIAAYRAEASEGSTVLVDAVQQMEEQGAHIGRMELHALGLRSINQIIADTLHRPLTDVEEVAELVLRKTQGIPLFVHEFLQTAYNKQALFFDYQARRWRWDMEQLHQIESTDNVVDLLVDQLRRLPLPTVNILKIAACVGNEFAMPLLAAVAKQSIDLSTYLISPAVEQGFVEVVDETQGIYRFVYSRIRQAVYGLLPLDEKTTFHLQIGQVILNMTDPEELEELIFNVTSQFNHAADLLSDQAGQEMLRRLNLMAAQKALSTAAYRPALLYFERVLSLSDESQWDSAYEQMLKVYLDAAQAALWGQQHKRAFELAEVAVNHAQQLMHKVQAHEIQIQVYAAQNQMLESVECSLETLRLMGVSIPKHPSRWALIREFLRVLWYVDRRGLNGIRELPPVTSADQLAIMRILYQASNKAYFVLPDLSPLLSLILVSQTARHGRSAFSVYGFAVYAAALATYLNRLEAAIEVGQFALKWLEEEADSNEIRPRFYVVYCLIVQHRFQAVRETIPLLYYGYRLALDQGNSADAAFCLTGYLRHLFYAGERLEVQRHEYEQYISSLRTLNEERHMTSYMENYLLVKALMGQTSGRYVLADETIDEARILQLYQQGQDFTALCRFHVYKTFLHVLYGDFEGGLAVIQTAAQYASAIRGSTIMPQFWFNQALLLLGCCETAEGAQRRSFLKTAAQNQKQLQKWADYAPMNYQHQADLVAAELARLRGDDSAAMVLYDQAIEGARRNLYLPEEALAHERAALFYLNRGQRRVAAVYLREARYIYDRWGAVLKVQQLDEQFGDLFRQSRFMEDGYYASTMSTTGHAVGALDLASFVKASQLIAGEILLMPLLEKMMRIVIENMGAQRGFLLQFKDEQWVIEASGTADDEDIKVLQSQSIQAADSPVSAAIIHYTARTRETVVLADATQKGLFVNDPYVIAHRPRSVLCTPIVQHDELIGLIYLENNLAPGAFTADRLEVLHLMSTQIAISIENASLYGRLEEYSRTLEQQVANRTAELQYAKESAEHARAVAEEANQAKSKFLANMSHELRTPLNAVIGYSEMLQEDLREMDYTEFLPDLERIESAGRHLLQLINDILDLSKIEAGQAALFLEWFDVDVLVNEVVGLIRPLLDKNNNALEINRAHEIGSVYADQMKVRQCLFNLLSNATKFTENGTVTVALDLLDGQVVFRVSDTGVGMSDEQLERIFEPFTQADLSTTRKYGGTGLGLSITQRFCEMMGGDISVISKLGEGSTFTMWLPVEVSLSTSLTE